MEVLNLKKKNAFLNLIKEQNNDNYSFIDKTYLYVKDPSGAKYQYLINKPENQRVERFNDFKVFIERSSDIDDIYKNIEQNDTNKKRKILIVFYFMIADMLSNKKLNLIATELFIRGRNFPLLTLLHSLILLWQKILD